MLRNIRKEGIERMEEPEKGVGCCPLGTAQPSSHDLTEAWATCNGHLFITFGLQESIMSGKELSRLYPCCPDGL